ncbi:hypothetical protein CHL67_09165 [Prosthecochloris sp. GSB1]|nr:hypothetical protein CHL67_09165 [Prosthecochloris sp. GSB1]
MALALSCLLAATSLELGACSNDTPKEPKPLESPTEIRSVIEPCDLVTQAEAEAILGEPLKPGERSEQQVVGLKLCMYNPQDENSTGFLQVTLTQPSFMPGGGLPPSELFRSVRDAMAEGRTDLEDFGDEAFIATGGLYILKDEYYVTIGAGNIDRPEIQERLKAAGKKALENLAARTR